MSRPKEWMPHQAACGQCGNRFETERHVDGRVKRHLCSQSCAALRQLHKRSDVVDAPHLLFGRLVKYVPSNLRRELHIK